jgi:hypothetical protein
MMTSVSETPTVRFRSSLFRVVIVRDDTRPWQPLADSLMAEFVVRLATNATEMIDHLKPIDRLACVCVLTDRIRVRDVHAAVIHAGGEADRIVLMSPTEPVDDVVHLVRRLSARRMAT